MFDMSWGEIMVIGGVALIVIGPKDLPKALRTVGQMTAKVRRMAGEFQSQFSEAMREAELQDVRKEVEGLNRDVTAATTAAFNPIQTLRDEIKGTVEPKSAATPEAEIWGTNPDPLSTATVPAEPVPLGHVTSGPVEEVGPVPHLVPVAAEPSPAGHAFPETQPLVPLPVEEPAPSAEGTGRQRQAAP